jgi:hypothetical protein
MDSNYRKLLKYQYLKKVSINLELFKANFIFRGMIFNRIVFGQNY